MRNRALAITRKNGRRPDAVNESALELAHCLPPEDGAERQMEAAELSRAISEFLLAQKPAVRTAFLRRYWYADTVRQTAQRLGWSVSKTKTVLFRTRNRLWDHLNKEGYL